MKGLIYSVLAIALIVAGCQTAVERDRPAEICFRDARPVDTTALVEAILDLKGVCIQSVAGSWKNNAFAAQMVMKGDGRTTTIVFLAPQMRLATVTLTRPHALKFEHVPQIPQAFEPEYMLADFAFVNLETEVLRRACGDAFRIADDGMSRTVSFADGTALAELVRAADGSAHYRNRVYDYEYDLQTESRTLTAGGERP